jgi:CRP-like cAMP-binding protein
MSNQNIEDLNLPTVEFKEGDVIIQEGEVNDHVYILQAGKVNVSVRKQDLCDVDVKGSVFGETSILLDSKTTATVKAVTDCSFLVIEEAEAIMKDNALVAFNIAHILALRLKHTTDLFLEVKSHLGEEHHSRFMTRFLKVMEVTNSFFDKDVKEIF